jgi:hypothetical protein
VIELHPFNNDYITCDLLIPKKKKKKSAEFVSLRGIYLHYSSYIDHELHTAI